MSIHTMKRTILDTYKELFCGKDTDVTTNVYADVHKDVSTDVRTDVYSDVRTNMIIDVRTDAYDDVYDNVDITYKLCPRTNAQSLTDKYAGLYHKLFFESSLFPHLNVLLQAEEQSLRRELFDVIKFNLYVLLKKNYPLPFCKGTMKHILSKKVKKYPTYYLALSSHIEGFCRELDNLRDYRSILNKSNQYTGQYSIEILMISELIAQLDEVCSVLKNMLLYRYYNHEYVLIIQKIYSTIVNNVGKIESEILFDVSFQSLKHFAYVMQDVWLVCDEMKSSRCVCDSTCMSLSVAVT